MAALKGVKTLDMVDGEITKVAYEGTEYEKTDSPVEAGDLFLLKEGHFIGGAEVGAFYTTKKYEDGDIVIPTASIGNASYTQSIGKGVAFRKKYTRLKVGDYAKVVDATEQDYADNGDIVKITKDDRDEVPFKCEIVAGRCAGDIFWAEEHELVLATEAEVAVAKEAEAKRSIEAKWAKIGRKVDEYKVGDIVAYNELAGFGNEGLGKVIEDSTCNSFPKIGAIDGCGDLEEYYVPRLSLTLITPVEARFDRS
ncbi:hypothetical protein ABEX06_00425 [Bacillus safensis]